MANAVASMCAKLLQSCPSLGNPMDCSLPCSPPGSSPWVFPPGDLPNPGIKSAAPVSPALQADSTSTTWEALAIALSKHQFVADNIKALILQIIFLCAHVYSKVKSLSRVWLFATPWTIAYQASLSMGFSRQEYWSGLLFPSPGELSNSGIEPRSPTL